MREGCGGECVGQGEGGEKAFGVVVDAGSLAGFGGGAEEGGAGDVELGDFDGLAGASGRTQLSMVSMNHSAM